jgi:hypothetical protein
MADVLNNTTNAAFIPTIIAQNALGRFASYMNLARTVARDFEYTAAREGQVLQIPKRGALVANAKTQGSEVTKQNPTATNVSVTLNQHFEVTIPIDDVTKVLQNQDTQDGYGNDGAIALAEKVETYIASLHPSITNTVTFDATSTATKKAQLLQLRKRFVENKVPKIETKYLYLDATVVNELLEEGDFTQAQTIGSGQATVEGEIMKLFGFSIFESQNVQTSGSPVRYHNLAYTKDAIILASRPLPSDGNGAGVIQTVIQNSDIGLGLRATMGYDKDLLAMQLTLDILFGASILDTRRVVELESS